MQNKNLSSGFEHLLCALRSCEACLDYSVEARGGEEPILRSLRFIKEIILPGLSPRCVAHEFCIRKEENQPISTLVKTRALTDSDGEFLSFLQ